MRRGAWSRRSLVGEWACSPAIRAGSGQRERRRWASWFSQSSELQFLELIFVDLLDHSLQPFLDGIGGGHFALLVHLFEPEHPFLVRLAHGGTAGGEPPAQVIRKVSMCIIAGVDPYPAERQQSARSGLGQAGEPFFGGVGTIGRRIPL